VKDKKTKTPSILAQKTKTWQALSRYVRSLSPYCYTCNGQASQAGHFIHNGDKPNKNLGGNALWYDLRNIRPQCSACNLYKSGNLTKYAERLVEEQGAGILKELHSLHRTPKKWTLQELKELQEYYERQYPPSVIE
jgi:hypothetical protein